MVDAFARLREGRTQINQFLLKINLTIQKIIKNTWLTQIYFLSQCMEISSRPCQHHTPIVFVEHILLTLFCINIIHLYTLQFQATWDIPINLRLLVLTCLWYLLAKTLMLRVPHSLPKNLVFSLFGLTRKPDRFGTWWYAMYLPTLIRHLGPEIIHLDSFGSESFSIQYNGFQANWVNTYNHMVWKH